MASATEECQRERQTLTCPELNWQKQHSRAVRPSQDPWQLGPIELGASSRI